MPKITIELSDEAFARLQERAHEGDQGFETQAARVLERSLRLSPQESLWVSKRFQTALTSIKGFISIMLTDEDGTMFAHPDRLEFYAIIDRECDALKACLQPVPFHAQPTRLKDILEAVRDEAAKSPYRLPTHTFVLEVGDNLPKTLLTDAEALKETLWMFLEDALRSSPQGGEVRLRLERPAPDTLTICITDQGQGFDPVERRELAERVRAGQVFITFRDKPVRDLGMPFIQWHQGTCEHDSPGPDKGASVTMTLRLFDESTETP
ncbi:sensor histidine kinase [Armatimonas rosea]|uniref:histidine kinase n=1 Tax=Armatimonas rosea TaxID=685828 RepID=A0A7W9STT4_ARMRO|nr:ATP-binding protein [Armatimonas rosea]MBB6051839.1 K+-sensing histidine kinase KdpD [Armatimonas rosea]